MSDTPTNQRSWWRQPPLWVGAAPLLIFLLVSAIDLALAKKFTDQGQTLISTLLGGLWQWMVLLLFLIALAIAVSPVGKLRLGGVNAKPSFKFFDWCAVLICTLLAGVACSGRQPNRCITSRPHHRCLRGSRAPQPQRWIPPWR